MARQTNIHIAVDTGMSRIGVIPDEHSAALVEEISQMDGIRVEGLFTHFAKADEGREGIHQKTDGAVYLFCKIIRRPGIEIPRNMWQTLPESLISRNSVVIWSAPVLRYMDVSVRRGRKKNRVPLRPAMSLNGYVTYVKTIEAGTEVSYGGIFKAEKPMRRATVCIGYVDGYPRSASNKGRVLIHGKSARILGRVCMDQLMVDVTDIPEVQPWDLVTLIGRDGDDGITMEELAEASGGFHYELACIFGKRVPRVYVKGGKIVGTKDYFHLSQYEDF